MKSGPTDNGKPQILPANTPEQDALDEAYFGPRERASDDGEARVELDGDEGARYEDEGQ